MTADRLEELIAAQQHLVDRSDLQSSLMADRTGITMPDGATVYFSERRNHYVLSSNYTGHYATAIEAVDDWLFYLSRKLNPGKVGQ